jgi:hypothetical protein
MLGVVTVHTVVSLLAPVAPSDRVATAMLIILLPFWWLFGLALLGFLALTAKRGMRLGYVASNNRWRGP